MAPTIGVAAVGLVVFSLISSCSDTAGTPVRQGASADPPQEARPHGKETPPEGPEARGPATPPKQVGTPPGQKGASEPTASEPETPPPERVIKAVENEASASQSAAMAQATERALREEQLQEAVRLMETAPTSPDAAFLLAMVYKEQGNAVEAVKHCERALDLDPTRADAYDTLGHYALLSEDYDAALEFSRQAMRLDASLVDARLRIAQTLTQMGKLEEAISELGENTPDSAGKYRLRGEAYLQLKQYERAKENFAAAARLKPDLVAAYYGLATTYMRLGLPEESQPYWDKFRELNARERELGVQIRATFQPLAVTCQSVAHTHTDVGRVYHQLGDVARAEKLWQRAAEIDPRSTSGRFELALLNQQRGRPAEALRMCEQIREIEPNEPINHLRIGLLNKQLKRYDAAEEAFRKVVELASGRPEGYLTLARMYLETGRNLPQAQEFASKAAGLRPSAANFFLLAQVCRKNGDREGCLDALASAIGLDPDNREYQQMYASLKEKE